MPDFSILDTLFSSSFFVCLLLFFFSWQRESWNNAFSFVLIFFAFVLIQSTLIYLPENLFRIPPDSIFYFQNSKEIAQSYFDWNVIQANFKPGLSNYGVNTYIFLQSILTFLFCPSYQFLHIFNIFLTSLTIFYSIRISRVLWGYGYLKYVVLCFLIYFSLYWHVLQNLREAPLLLFMILSLYNYILWWKCHKNKKLILCIIFGIFSLLLRPENVLLFLAVLALTQILKPRKIDKKILAFIILAPPLILVTIDIAFKLGNSDPLRLINAARAIRLEGGGYQLTDTTVSSYWELILDFPNTLRFFLMPIYPWEIKTGLIYFKAYVHSLSCFVLLIFGMIGIRRKLFSNKDKQLKKMLLILLAGYIIMASLYSFADISAGGSSRHSTLFYFFFLSIFSPIGAKIVINKIFGINNYRFSSELSVQRSKLTVNGLTRLTE